MSLRWEPHPTPALLGGLGRDCANRIHCYSGPRSRIDKGVLMDLRPHPEFEHIKDLWGHVSKPSAVGTAYRFVAPRYANGKELLSGKGSLIIDARWTPKGAFEAVYGSLEPDPRWTNCSQITGTTGSRWGALPRVFAAFTYHSTTSSIL